MENFEFKSAVCSTKEQSERLLKLGLKKETADCGHFYVRQKYEVREDWETVILDDNWKSYWDITDKGIPAWSLHRLIEILYNGTSESIKHLMKLGYKDMNYDTIITCIEDLIKLNQFNKDYLEEKV